VCRDALSGGSLSRGKPLGENMNGFMKALLITAATIAVVSMFPDLKRYIRISTM